MGLIFYIVNMDTWIGCVAGADIEFVLDVGVRGWI